MLSQSCPTISPLDRRGHPAQRVPVDIIGVRAVRSAFEHLMVYQVLSLVGEKICAFLTDCDLTLGRCREERRRRGSGAQLFTATARHDRGSATGGLLGAAGWGGITQEGREGARQAPLGLAGKFIWAGVLVSWLPAGFFGRLQPGCDSLRQALPRHACYSGSCCRCPALKALKKTTHLQIFSPAHINLSRQQQRQRQRKTYNIVSVDELVFSVPSVLSVPGPRVMEPS